MAVGRLLKRSCAHLSDAEAAAYDAPFPDARFKAGVRRFPNLVPDRPDAPGAALSRRARHWWQHEWHGCSFMAICRTTDARRGCRGICASAFSRQRRQRRLADDLTAPRVCVPLVRGSGIARKKPGTRRSRSSVLAPPSAPTNPRVGSYPLGFRDPGFCQPPSSSPLPGDDSYASFPWFRPTSRSGSVGNGYC